jgi:diguanylate cyclase (GGDEF)-like protein/PAS domain S-box-containing protein
MVMVAAAYFGSARLGLDFGIGGSGVTPVWPPAGIALAAVLIGGYRMVPAVAVGALAATATTSQSLGPVLSMTVANLVEVVVGVALLRQIDFRRSLDRVSDVIAITALGGMLATAVGAAVGIGGLIAFGSVSAARAPGLWRAWWLADFDGVMLVGTAILVLARKPAARVTLSTVALGLMLAGGVSALGFVLMHDDRATAYLALPVVFSLALLYRQVGAVLGALAVAGLAVWLSSRGQGPFVGGSAGVELLRAQTFVSIGATMGLLVAAVRSEHQVAEAALRRLAEGQRTLNEAQRAVQLAEERFRALFQDAPYALVVFDTDGRIALANSQSERMFGYAGRELIGQSVEALVPTRPGLGTPWYRTENKRDAAQLELRARRFDGHEFPIEVSLTPLSSGPGTLISAAIRDVTEVREAAAALAHRASHDALTGLPNRTLFVDRLEQALHRARRSARTLAVVFVDLDDFKVVNDTYGHAAGDRLLVGLTPRLRAAVRPGDTIARFGGDEFVVLCEDLLDESDAAQIAQRIADAASVPLMIGEHEIGVSVSAGLVLVKAAERARAADVLRDADAAMYRSKRAGKGRVVIFDEGMRERLIERVALQSALRGARDRDELRLLYQPVFALDQRKMVAVEALLRWQHPEHGLLEPADFIQVAESSGLIGEIGEWAIEEACRQAAEWRDAMADREPIHVSVNLSPWQVARSDIAVTVARILESTGLEPELLALEVAENTLLQDEAAASRVLRDLKAIGVSLVLDDFGTGYHSIGNLKRLTIDGLKLDRSFVGRLGQDTEDEAIISAVLSMAGALEVGVTAEGVETPEQLSRLRSHGCEFAQGYLLAPPASADEVEGWLEDEVSDRAVASRRARGSGASGREAGVQQLHRLIGRIARVQ